MKYEVGSYAFWKYTGLPTTTYLSGVVTGSSDYGFVSVEGYHPGYMFRPVHVTDVATGRRLSILLKQYEERRDAAIKEANDSFEAQRDALFNGPLLRQQKTGPVNPWPAGEEEEWFSQWCSPQYLRDKASSIGNFRTCAPIYFQCRPLDDNGKYDSRMIRITSLDT